MNHPTLMNREIEQFRYRLENMLDEYERTIIARRAIVPTQTLPIHQNRGVRDVKRVSSSSSSSINALKLKSSKALFFLLLLLLR